jgi:hypothetical protein
MKGTKVRVHSTGGKVVFSITAAQLAQLRQPDRPLYRKAKRDPRDTLCEKGLLRSIIGAGKPTYEITREGGAVLLALGHKAD